MISLRLGRLSKSSPRRNTRGSGNGRSSHYSPPFLRAHTLRSTLWTEIVLGFVWMAQIITLMALMVEIVFWKSEWSQWFYWGPLSVTTLTTHSLCAATRHFGDQSMAATWSKELRGSRTAGPCLSSTLWRATWGKDDERPHLFWTRTKRSAPSPHFQRTLICTLQFLSLFLAFLWRWEQNKNKQGLSFLQAYSNLQTVYLCQVTSYIKASAKRMVTTLVILLQKWHFSWLTLLNPLYPIGGHRAFTRVFHLTLLVSDSLIVV